MSSHLRLVVFGGALIGLIGIGPLFAGAAEEKAVSKVQAAPAPNAATDMISLETDAKVTAPGIRREVDAAKAAELAKAERKSQTMTGIIVAKGFGGIAFSPGTKLSSSEMWLPFEPGLKLIGYPSLDHVRDGDLVNVTYEERVTDHEYFLKKIALMQRAPEAQP